jgi:GNAT superfamily N-acetyltransferase
MTRVDFPVRPLRETEVDAAAELLATSFDDDPSYAYLMRGASRARADRGLIDAFAVNLRIYLQRRCTHVVPADDGGILACLTRRSPEGVPSSLTAILRCGFLRYAARNGLGPVRRALWMKDTYERFERRVTRGAPHWFFTMLAVRSDARGKGLGLKLFAHLLEEARGAPSLLITNQAANMKRFLALGFDVAATQEMAPPGIRPYTAWCLRRPAP